MCTTYYVANQFMAAPEPNVSGNADSAVRCPDSHNDLLLVVKTQDLDTQGLGSHEKRY